MVGAASTRETAGADMTTTQWLDQLARSWMPHDPVRLDDGMRGWLQLRYDIVTRLRPRSIVEIGVRAGYSAFAMLSAAPDAHYTGFDIRTDAHGGFVGAHEHAAQLLSRFPNVTLREADSRTLDEVPAADLIHIDGDHSREGCLSDLELALRSGVRWALVDDTSHIRAVKIAVAEFAIQRELRMQRFNEPHRGAVLLDLSERL